jgi:hypothetical protein
MISDEVGAFIELAAMKAAKQAIMEARIEWRNDIARDLQLHSSTCAVGKYRAVAHVVSASIGGILVVILNWVIRRL